MSEKEFLLSFGFKIRKLRLEKGFRNMDDFSLTAGMNATTYQRCEVGHNMTLKTLHKILDFHNITLKEFINS